MSNIITVQYTKFENLDHDGNPVKEPMFGFRIYDDYGVGYENTFDSIEDLKEQVNTDTLLGVIHGIKGFEDVDETSCNAICFNGDYYYWDKDGNLSEEREDSDIPS